MSEDSEKKPKSKLLAMLPKPKNVVPEKSKTLLIPTALTKSKTSTAVPSKRKIDEPSSNSPLISNKPKVAKVEVISSMKSLVNYGSSSEDENTDNEFNAGDGGDSCPDLLGITTSKFDVNPVPVSLPVFEPTQSDAFVGPQKPPPKPFDDESSPSTSSGMTTEKITKIIYEKELAPYGGDRALAVDAASNIIDVSVDRALGPNIRENLLKSLSNKAMGQLTVGPLPKVKKDPKDRIAKQKHQITHLAGLAVAREEMLQEQWADNKQKKRASARKYGF